MVPSEPQDDLEHAVQALLDKYSEEDIKDMLKHVKRQSMRVPKLVHISYYSFIIVSDTL